MDNVNIESVGGNSNLEDWASEETLQILVRLTLDNKKLATKQTAAITEILKLLKKAHKSSGKGNSTNTVPAPAAQQKATKAQTQATQQNTTAKDDNTKQTSIATSAMGALAFAAGSLVKLFTDSYGTYNNLIKYGAIVQGQYEGLSGNFGDLGILMKSSGASLASLEKAITTSSRAIKMFGVKTFADTVGQVSEQLYKFGFTNSESAEYIAKDLESRRRAGLINNVTNAQYQQGLIQGTKNLMKFSKILGENWESLQQDSSAALDANASFQLWIRTLGEGTKAYENAYQSAQNVSMAFGAELGGLVADMAAVDSGAIGTDKTYVSLVKGAGQEVADMLFNVSRKIRNGSLNTEESFNYLAGVAQKAKDFGVNNQQLLQILKNSIGEDAALKVSAQLLGLAESAEAAADGGYLLVDAENKYQESLKQIQSNFDKIFINFKGTWIKGLEEVFNSPKTQEALNLLFNTISGALGGDTFQKLVSGTLSAITGLVEKSIKWLGEQMAVDESGKNGLERMMESATTFFTDTFPKMVTELTIMAKSVTKFIENLQKGGISGALFGASDNADLGDSVSRVTTKDIRSKGRANEYSEALALVNQSDNNKKLLKDAEKIWSDPMYKSILDQHNYVPKQLENVDRAIVELARENIKSMQALPNIPSTSLFPTMSFDKQVVNKMPLPGSNNLATKTKVIESYAARNLTPPIESKQDAKQTEEASKAIASASENIQTNTEQSKAPAEQDKIQPLVYTLDMLTSELQSLTLVPELLVSINNVLTSIKNGQNTRLA